jgi:hypothetical protein
MEYVFRDPQKNVFSVRIQVYIRIHLCSTCGRFGRPEQDEIWLYGYFLDAHASTSWIPSMTMPFPSSAVADRGQKRNSQTRRGPPVAAGAPFPQTKRIRVSGGVGRIAAAGFGGKATSRAGLPVAAAGECDAPVPVFSGGGFSDFNVTGGHI